MPISIKEARAIVAYAQSRFLERHYFTFERKHLLATLEKKIADQMTKFEGGVFVRLTGMSPKDGLPLTPDGKSLYDLFSEATHSIADVNQKAIVIARLQMQLLKCTSARHVMNLLLTSERAEKELLEAIEHNSPVNLIFRRWEGALRDDLEFRVFVHERRIVAISQYNHYCCFDVLAGMDEAMRCRLRDKIIEYVGRLLDRIEPPSYVMDVALIEEKNVPLIEGRLVTIELNPFLETTGAALFDWKQDSDLLHGRMPVEKPEFRIHRQPILNIGDFVTCVFSDLESKKRDECYVGAYNEYYDTLVQCFAEKNSSQHQGCCIC